MQSKNPISALKLIYTSTMRPTTFFHFFVLLPTVAILMWPVSISAETGMCINSRGETVREGSRDGSFVCKSGKWVYLPYN